MITYTGLITLVLMYMPWPIVANYQKPADFLAEAYGRENEEPATGHAAPLAAIGPMMADATALWGGGTVRTIVIRNPNDAGATVTIQRSPADGLNARGASTVYSGATGRRLSASAPAGAAINTAGVMLGLHLGQFAGPVLRWTYFLLSLTGTAMVGTGLLRSIGQRLNIGVPACPPAGMAAFLLANRLIPAALPGRAAMEVSAMFWVWFGMAALSCFRPVARAWPETLAVSAIAFALIPWVNLATTDRGFVASFARGDLLFVGVHLATSAIGGLLGIAAWRTAKPKSTLKTPRRVARAMPQEAMDAA